MFMNQKNSAAALDLNNFYSCLSVREIKLFITMYDFSAYKVDLCAFYASDNKLNFAMKCRNTFGTILCYDCFGEKSTICSKAISKVSW